MYHSLMRKPSHRVVLLMGLLIGPPSLLLLAACEGENSAKGGGGGEHKKITRSFAGPASTDGLIAFRRYLDLEGTKSASFTMYLIEAMSARSPIPQRVLATTPLHGPPMGRRSPSIARQPTRALAGSWSSTPKQAMHARWWGPWAWKALILPSHQTGRCWHSAVGVAGSGLYGLPTGASLSTGPVPTMLPASKSGERWSLKTLGKRSRPAGRCWSSNALAWRTTIQRCLSSPSTRLAQARQRIRARSHPEG